MFVCVRDLLGAYTCRYVRRVAWIDFFQTMSEAQRAGWVPAISRQSVPLRGDELVAVITADGRMHRVGTQDISRRPGTSPEGLRGSQLVTREVRKAFELLDVDGSEILEMDEVYAALAALEVDRRARHVKAILKRVDKEGDKQYARRGSGCTSAHRALRACTLSQWCGM